MSCLSTQVQTNKARTVSTREACSAGHELFRNLCKEVDYGQRLSCVICPVSQSSNSCALSPDPVCYCPSVSTDTGCLSVCWGSCRHTNLECVSHWPLVWMEAHFQRRILSITPYFFIKPFTKIHSQEISWILDNMGDFVLFIPKKKNGHISVGGLHI